MDLEAGEREVFADDMAVDGIVFDEQDARTFGGGWVHRHGDSGKFGLRSRRCGITKYSYFCVLVKHIKLLQRD